MSNRSAPSATITPSLIYSDVGQAIPWLCGAFGFKERLRVSGPDGKVGHAQLIFGDGAIMLGAARPGDGADALDPAVFRAPNPSIATHQLSVRVTEVDAHCERAKAYGARIIQLPTTHVFGERQYTALDLDGHRWTFTQTVADIDPARWGAFAST